MQLVRIPWSHYCKKVEWALSANGIPYDTLDVSLKAMRKWALVLPEGTVPVLKVDRVIAGSSNILRWLDDQVGGLYPADAAQLEKWADDEIGPVARRVAYQTIHDTPRAYGDSLLWHMVFRLARRQVLGVLKHYKARRFVETDRLAVGAILRKIERQLENSGTGFLFGNKPSAADYATTALVSPMLPIRNLSATSGPTGQVVREYVRRVKPKTLTRRRRRWARAKDLKAWRTAGSAPT